MTRDQIQARYKAAGSDFEALGEVLMLFGSPNVDLSDPGIKALEQQVRRALEHARALVDGDVKEPMRPAVVRPTVTPGYGRTAAYRTAPSHPRHSDARASGHSPSVSRDWGPLLPLFERNNLSEPNGQPLYAYRISDADADGLRKAILQESRRLLHGHPPPPWMGAAVVLSVAERWRGEQLNMSRTWEPLLSPFGLASLPPKGRTELIEDGLKRLRRGVEERAGRRQWLLTIALEAGFPLKALANDGGGWLSRYLDKVLPEVFALPQPDEEQAHKIAEKHKSILRVTFQTEEFLSVTAKLATALAEERQFVPKAETDHISWLYRNRPDWQSNLPLRIDDAAAKALLDGLLRKHPVRPPADIAVRRLLLRRQDGTFAPAVVFGLSGAINATSVLGLNAGEGRHELTPTGSWSAKVSGTAAILYPAADVGGDWQLHQLLRQTEISGVGFHERISFLARSQAQTRELTWPKGDPRLGDILVFEPDGTTPDRWKLLGEGTLSHAAEKLVVVVPNSWILAPHSPEGAPPELLGSLDDGRMQIWQITAPTVCRDPSEQSGVYRVRPGATVSSQTLPVKGDSGDFEPDDRRWIVMVRTARIAVPNPAAVRVEYKRDGDRSWSPMHSFTLKPGAWRVRSLDRLHPFILAEARVLVLPAPAPRAVSINSITWQCDNRIGNWDFEPLETDKTLRDNQWQVTTTSGVPPTVAVQMRETGRPEIRGRIRVTARRPGFVDEEQTVLKSGELLTLDGLSHIRAFAPAKERLRIIGEGSRGMDEIIPFDRELRLRPLIPLIEQALAASNPARPIDGEVTVEFFGDYSRSLRVKRFSQDTKLQEVDEALILLSEERGQLVRRPLCEPWREEPVELLPSTTLEGHAVVSRTGWVGPQILYWRDGNRVITRPSKPYDGSELPADLEDTQSLAWAACRPDSYSSREALNKWHAAQDANQSAATICKVAASLNGLSAVALNFMLEAPQESLALALLEATADQLPAVWDLQRELSFSWSMLPLKVWRQGIRKWMQPFKDRLDDPIVRELLDSMLQERVEQVAGYDPILQVILERASSSRHHTTVTDVEAKDRFQALARSVAALADDFHRPPIDRFPNAIPQAFRVHTDEFGEEIQEVIRCAAGFAALVGRASAGRSDVAALQEHRQIIHAWRRALDRTFDNVALMFLDHHLRFWTPT